MDEYTFQEDEKPKAATNKTTPPKPAAAANAAKPAEAAPAAKPAPVVAPAAASPPLKKPMSPPKAVKTPKASIVQRKRKAEKGWLSIIKTMGLRLSKRNLQTFGY